MAYSAGTAFVQVAPSMRGFHQEIRRELTSIRPEPTVRVKVTPDVDRTSFTNMPRVPDQTVKVKAEVDSRSWVDASNAVAMLMRNAAVPVAVVGAAAALPTVLALGQAAVTASQSLLLLPAAGFAVGAAMIAGKIGMSGFGDAMKHVMDQDPEKFNKALEGMSPAARATAMEIRGLRPELQGLRTDVQDALFRDMNTTVGELAGTYLPMLRTQVTGVAAELNVGAQGIATFVGQAATVRDVETMFVNTREAMSQLNPAGVAIVQILRDIGVVGSDFLPGLAAGLTDMTQRARDFVAAARESGRLREWISDGLDALGLFGQTFLAVGDIVRGIYRALNVDSHDFLVNLRDGTREVAAFVNSAQGQTALTDMFSSLRDIAAALAPVVGIVALLLIDMITRLGPLVPPAADAFMRWAEAARPVFDIFWWAVSIVLPPLLGLLGDLAPVLAPLAAIGIIAAGVTKFVEVLKSLKIILEGAKIAWAALNFVMGLSPFGMIVIAVGLLVAALVYAWQNSETFRAIVTEAWNKVKEAAVAAKDWIVDAWAKIVEKGREAAEWFQSGLTSINTKLSELGAWFTGLWRDYVVPAWEGIVEIGRWALAILLLVIFAPIQIAINALGALWTELADIIGRAWTVIQEEAAIWWNFLRDTIFTPVSTFITGTVIPAWNRLRDEVIAVWNRLTERTSAWWNAEVKPILDAVVNFVTVTIPNAYARLRDELVARWDEMYQRLANWWNSEVRPLWDAVVTFVTVTIPGAYQRLRDELVARWNEMWQRLSQWWNSEVMPLWQGIVSYLSATFGPAYTVLRDLVISAWNTMRDGMNAVWGFVRDNIWNPMVQFITVTIPEGFNRGVDFIQRAWDRVKAALRTPLQAAIDIVWNNGIVKVWGEVARIAGINSTLSTFNLPALARGGPINRPTLALVGEAGPEYVVGTDTTRALGGVSGVEDLVQNARQRPRAALKALNSGSIIEGADHNTGGYSTVGFGGVRPHVAQAGHYLRQRFGISSVGGVGARGNVSDHPSGHALDFMTRGANGDALAGFLSSPANWGHFAIKYQIWKQRIQSSGGGPWVPMANRGNDTANHFDHVHVSFLGGPGSGAMDGGGAGPSLIDLVTTVWKTVTDALGALSQIGSHPWAQLIVGVMKNAVGDLWKFISGKVAAGVAAVATGVGGGVGSASFGTFDQGGVLYGSGLFAKEVISPERVLSPRQNTAFETLVGSLTRSGTVDRYGRGFAEGIGGARAAGGGAPLIGNLTVPVPPGSTVDDTLDAVFTRSRHEQRRGRYGRPA